MLDHELQAQLGKESLPGSGGKGSATLRACSFPR